MTDVKSKNNTSKFWLDIAADEIVRRYPEGEIIVSSGISPSASYHIGHFREIMTAEALAWAVGKRGRKARHLHVVDNFDPLRKWYDFLPPAKKDYTGQPVALVEDPYGDCHPSYADHFFAEFEQYLKPMGLAPEIIRSYEDLYLPNHMTPYIEAVLENLQKSDFIRKIFSELSNRELPANWTPVQLLDPTTNVFINGHLDTWDRKAQALDGISYVNGHAKLNWRLDWPARWAYLKVQVEPFGAQEHGAAGGSYDTGREFARQVFKIEPPYGEVRYGHIHRPHESFKMSSSKGNGVTPGEALQIMPPEILRYFIVRSRPEKKLVFDPGIGLYNLIDEFAAAQNDSGHQFRDAYNFAAAGDTKPVISSVSFKHLVQVYQAAQGDSDECLRILERTGYATQVKKEQAVILAELPFVKNWLAKYAPEEVKFTVQPALPQAEPLTDEQRGFLTILAAAIEEHSGEIDGQAMHELIYAAKDQANLPAPAAFQAIYRVILGKDFGPKAGWFLASLDRDFLIKRLHIKG
ncbi:MAG TPA: lysine--tRNA ligase [Candidatus Saccharimonadales bacterium]|nr:lysine--tRNA ligase [Candidatus Saccharimonadales bacterium]